MNCWNCQSTNEDSWKYCSACGSILGRLNVQPRYEVPGGPTFPISFTLDIPVPIDYRIESEEIDFNEPKGVAQRLLYLQGTWKTPGANQPGRVHVYTSDGVRDNLWKVGSERCQTMDVVPVQVFERITISPATLIFVRGRSERSFSIANEGNIAKTLSSVQVPLGTRLDISTPQTLCPGESITIKAFLQPEFSEGEIVLAFDDGPQVTVPIVRIEMPPRTVPDVYVGIDFGTRNTSVSCRMHGDMKAVSLDIFGGGTRIPSDVHCPDTERQNWVFGDIAAENWSKSNHKGVFIQELKSDLRKDPDATFPAVPGITRRDILSEFFRRLLSNVIQPHLMTHCPQSLQGSAVEFSFSVPVLDQSEESCAYQSLIEEVARASGFERFGCINVALEPACAASYLIQEKAIDCAPGDRLIIFDTGGGTTDICEGEVAQDQQGRLTLKEPKSQAVIYRDRQFGGGTVTWAMGHLWHKDHPVALMAAVDETIFDNEGRSLRPIDDVHFLEASPADDHAMAGPTRPWKTKYPSFYERTEKSKINPKTDAEAAEIIAEIKKGPLGPDDPKILLVTESWLGGLARQFCSRFRDQLTGIAAGGPPLARWVMVGGNSRLPGLVDAVRSIFPVETVSPEVADLAVSLGGAWIGQWMTDGAPHPVRVSASHVDSRVIPAGGRTMAAEWPRLGRNVQVPTGTEHEIKIEAQIGGEWVPLKVWKQTLNLLSAVEIIRTTYTISSSCVSLQVQSDAANYGKVEYEF